MCQHHRDNRKNTMNPVQVGVCEEISVFSLKMEEMWPSKCYPATHSIPWECSEL